MPFRSLLAASLLSPVFAVNAGAQTTTLNLSHDLVSAGIAKTNMTPGQPSLDARPLLEAAVAYAATHGIANLTADAGNYYFLSQHNANTHVLISGASNLQLNLQNSDLFFAFSNVAAIQCSNCSNTTLANFSVDYQQLPFTQVIVGSVNAAAQTFTYRTIAGYQDPAAFNANRAPDGSDAIYMFVFRDGIPIQEVGRLSAARPVTGGVIAISDTKDPWATPAALSAIQPGDTVVFTDRSGPPAVNIVNGSNVTIEGVSVYSSGQIGVYFGRTNGATADHVQIIPRPGTSRLISTNADGIHTSFALNANVFTNNTVRRTCDDALAISDPWLATVTQVSGASVTVARSFASPFPTGTTIGFINPATAAVIGTATISSETPPFAQQTLTDGESVTLTLNQPIPGLAANFGIVDTDPSKLGSGSVIAYNTVQDGVFARGVWFSGVTNASAHDNLIQRTSSNGIFVQQLSANNSDTGPASNITIQDNLVDSSIGYGNVSHGLTFAAASIYAVSQSSQNAQVATSPNANIVVAGNRVTNAARSAIRIENVNGGQMARNTIEGFGLAPTVNAFTAPSCCETLAQYESDFSQAILTPTSVGISANGNSVSSAANLVESSSNANGYPRVAAGSIVSAYGTDIVSTPVVAPGPEYPLTLGGLTVSITDSSGAVWAAPIEYVSPGQVNYVIPAGVAPGIATVAMGSFTGALQLDTAAPGLYSLYGANGVAAATAGLYALDGSATPVTVFQCTATCTPVPMSLGSATDLLAVVLYGTGFRNAPSNSSASVTIGGVQAQILYIGSQPTYMGLDQVNVIVPRSLAGAGEVPVVFTLNGQTANSVLLNIR